MTKVQTSYRRHSDMDFFKGKPSQSYATLIGKAILEQPERRARLATIYQWIYERFPYFKKGDASWQNSIRHNLTVQDCFQKDIRDTDPSGKGVFWTISPKYLDLFINEEYDAVRAAAQDSKKRYHKIHNSRSSMGSTSSKSLSSSQMQLQNQQNIVNSSMPAYQYQEVGLPMMRHKQAMSQYQYQQQPQKLNPMPLQQYDAPQNYQVIGHCFGEDYEVAVDSDFGDDSFDDGYGQEVQQNPYHSGGHQQFSMPTFSTRSIPPYMTIFCNGFAQQQQQHPQQQQQQQQQYHNQNSIFQSSVLLNDTQLMESQQLHQASGNVACNPDNKA
ncbi:hypothetical protein MIR68_010538 [Amoeboaphelidium protococcarum]|nr:hypothetical protein MIR68_010538 [Amoeboaphelidium protococcarum]